jgi:ABC-type dipeptide/oligopeptide/nickel transport system ATPase subunit
MKDPECLIKPDSHFNVNITNLQQHLQSSSRSTILRISHAFSLTARIDDRRFLLHALSAVAIEHLPTPSATP